MTIDWSATGQMIAGIGTIASTAAVFWAARIGKGAISDFQDQKIAERRIEGADMVLIAADRAFDALAQMQSRVVRDYETHSAKNALVDAGVDLAGFDKGEKSAVVIRAVVYQRAEFFKDDFDAIFKALPKARVYFGHEVATWLTEFPKARNNILLSADMLPMAAKAGDHDRDYAAQLRRDVFGGSAGEPNEIRDKLCEAKANLERVLLPILKPGKQD